MILLRINKPPPLSFNAIAATVAATVRRRCRTTVCHRHPPSHHCHHRHKSQGQYCGDWVAAVGIRGGQLAEAGEGNKSSGGWGAKGEVGGGCFGAAAKASDGGGRQQRQWWQGGGEYPIFTEFWDPPCECPEEDFCDAPRQHHSVHPTITRS